MTWSCFLKTPHFYSIDRGKTVAVVTSYTLFLANINRVSQRRVEREPGQVTVRQAYLEVSALGLQPVVDEALRVPGEAEHELSLGLQLVDGLNGLMDLWRGGGVSRSEAILIKSNLSNERDPIQPIVDAP